MTLVCLLSLLFVFVMSLSFCCAVMWPCNWCYRRRCCCHGPRQPVLGALDVGVPAVVAANIAPTAHSACKCTCVLMIQEALDAYYALGLHLLSPIVAVPGTLAGFSVLVAAAAPVARQPCNSKFRWCCVGDAVGSTVACSVVAPFLRVALVIVMPPARLLLPPLRLFAFGFRWRFTLAVFETDVVVGGDVYAMALAELGAFLASAHVVVWVGFFLRCLCRGHNRDKNLGWRRRLPCHRPHVAFTHGCRDSWRNCCRGGHTLDDALVFTQVFVGCGRVVASVCCCCDN